MYFDANKVKTSFSHDIKNEEHVCGLIFIYLLILITHVTEYLSTPCECARDDNRGVS